MELGVAIYRMHSRIHWIPRVSRVISSLSLFAADNGQSPRIVDFGCGPGNLVEQLPAGRIKYLGIDPDAERIEFARAHFSHHKNLSEIEFVVDDDTGLESILTENDILILNGVVHHLTDASLERVEKAATRCRGIIIVDHDKAPTAITPRTFIPRLLQHYDLGKYIREPNRYAQFAGRTPKYEEFFPIRFMGITLLPHFCRAY